MPGIPFDGLLKGYSLSVGDELQVFQLCGIGMVVDFGRDASYGADSAPCARGVLSIGTVSELDDSSSSSKTERSTLDVSEKVVESSPGERMINTTTATAVNTPKMDRLVKSVLMWPLPVIAAFGATAAS